MRRFVAQSLSRDNYDVVEIGNGLELTNWLQKLGDAATDEREIDIVVSDIHMPGKTALEVLGDFRHVVREIPIILVTAFGSEETHERARELGAAAVLDKPFDLDQLRSVMREILESSGLADRPPKREQM